MTRVLLFRLLKSSTYYIRHVNSNNLANLRDFKSEAHSELEKSPLTDMTRSPRFSASGERWHKDSMNLQYTL